MRFHIRFWLISLGIILLSGCVNHPVNTSLSNQNVKNISQQYVTVHHGCLECYRFGKGSPIVLISGYMTDISSWDKQFLAVLAAKHEVIVFNNRNVGGSYVHSKNYSSQDLANDTYQLIQQLHLKKPAVLGVSMGGMIAQQVAVLYPNKLGSLILINAAISGDQAIRPSPDMEKQMLNMPTNKLGLYNFALQLFFPESQRTEMAWALLCDRFQPPHYNEIDPEAVMAQQKILLMQWTNDNATAKKLAHLNLPVLILNGDADAVIPPANSDILAKTIPRAQLKRWKDGGHGMIYQYPESIANAINNFISGSKL